MWETRLIKPTVITVGSTFRAIAYRSRQLPSRSCRHPATQRLSNPLEPRTHAVGGTLEAGLHHSIEEHRHASHPCAGRPPPGTIRFARRPPFSRRLIFPARWPHSPRAAMLHRVLAGGVQMHHVEGLPTCCITRTYTVTPHTLLRMTQHHSCLHANSLESRGSTAGMCLAR